MVEGGGPAGSQDAEQNENASSVVNGSRDRTGPSGPNSTVCGEACSSHSNRADLRRRNPLARCPLDAVATVNPTRSTRT